MADIQPAPARTLRSHAAAMPVIAFEQLVLLE